MESFHELTKQTKGAYKCIKGGLCAPLYAEADVGCPNFPDAEKMAQYAQEERNIREENLRLQRRLQLEMERRENLCRHLSESESSLEMDDERLAMSIH